MSDVVCCFVKNSIKSIPQKKTKKIIIIIIFSHNKLPRNVPPANYQTISPMNSPRPEALGWLRSTGATYAVHIFSSLSALLLTIWIFKHMGGVALEGNELFNWHPLLMGFAFALIVPEAVLLFRPASGLSRWIAKYLHAALQGTAMLLAVLGVSAVYKNHEDKGYSHARSLHSWVGLGTVTLMVAQWLLGDLAFLTSLFTANLRIKAVPLHIAVGTAIVFLSTLAMCMGILEKTIFDKTCDTLGAACIVANFAGLSIIMTSLCVLFVLSNPKRTLTSAPRAAESFEEAHETNAEIAEPLVQDAAR